MAYMRLRLRPISLADAQAFIERHHRHRGKVVGHKFSIGVVDDDGVLRGVVVAGRPVARELQDGVTAEVTRLCTDGSPNACSMLYAAAWRAARAMGYERMGTYILASEDGTTLRAAGWRFCYATRAGRSWDAPSRPRDHGDREAKERWEVSAAPLPALSPPA